MLEVHNPESLSRWVPEDECYSKLEAYGRYHVAKQWQKVQGWLRDVAWGMAWLAGLTLLCVSGECEWRARVVQEEHAGWASHSSRASMYGRGVGL